MASSASVLLIIDFITYTFKVKECEKRLTTQMNDVERQDENPFDEWKAKLDVLQKTGLGKNAFTYFHFIFKLCKG